MTHQPKIPKFDRASRTFETRVSFIRDIFSAKYNDSVILTSCIEHKLGVSLQNYEDDLKYTEWLLNNEDPIEVLKRIDR